MIQAQADSVRVYPAPEGEPLSKQFTVSVEKQDSPVYLAKVRTDEPKDPNQVPEEASFTSFEVLGSAQIVVTCPVPVTEAKILPISSGIKPTVSGNQIAFEISAPGQLTLEVNGDWMHSLHLFANALETDIPKADDPNVIYFGPGRHEVTATTVYSGKTIYVAGGAVLYGKPAPGSPKGSVFALEGKDITLRGPGVIDGSLCPLHTHCLVQVKGTNITVRDVVLRDSSTWTMPLFGVNHVQVKNVKILGWRPNSDGIDICNSQNVDVTGCFLRTWDDLVVVKTQMKGGGESRDITVTKCVLWNELAHALSVGAELRDDVENVRFADCDVIRDKGREWLLRIYHCDGSTVHNVTFENIRIEESRRLISCWINKAIWSKDTERGHIENITFRNIDATGADPLVALEGFDAAHEVANTLFDHVVINGQALKELDIKQNAFVTGTNVIP